MRLARLAALEIQALSEPEHGGRLAAEALAAHGVRFVFTLCGGHISPLLLGAKAAGIRVIDVRHEATAVYAADAVARLTGVPGVACVTAGPGLTNTVTAVKNAQLAQSPVDRDRRRFRDAAPGTGLTSGHRSDRPDAAAREVDEGAQTGDAISSPPSSARLWKHVPVFRGPSSWKHRSIFSIRKRPFGSSTRAGLGSSTELARSSDAMVRGVGISRSSF